MRQMHWTLLGLALVSLIVLPTVTSAEEDGNEVKGEVVQVQKQMRTQNGAEYDQLTIRTRQGEQMRLRLRLPDDCDGCIQNGDRVRVRLMGAEAEGGGQMVREMKVRRTGATYRFEGAAAGATGSGERMRSQSRSGDADGSGDRARARTRTNAVNANGTCTRTRSGGTGGQRSGGRR